MTSRKQDLSQRILALLRSTRYQPLDEVGLSKKLALTSNDLPEFGKALHDLEECGEIARIRKNCYVIPEAAELCTGTLQVHVSGNAHLISERPGQQDLYVSAANTGTAMNGDTVVARIIHKEIAGVERLRRTPVLDERREGRVIRILKRATDTIVGTLQQTKNFFYVIPDDPRFIHDVYVHPTSASLQDPPKVGDKVVIRLDEWKSRHVNPEGEIVEVLGAASAPGVDMLSIIRKHNLSTDFPDSVSLEAERIPEQVASEEIRRREDLREALIYTIDPDDARDFDDAIQVEKFAGGWRVGVHIADVSHYVTPGSELDREAYLRGTSIYLADRVIPMLPTRLSNGICSLKPNVERLTRSVFMEFTSSGKMKNARFSKSVIRSVARLTYKQAYAILTGNTPDPLPATVPDRTEEIPQAVADNIRLTWELASLLRKNRFAQGSLDLDFPEVKVWLDQNGTPVKLEKIDNDISHQLIEELMVASNEAVARETKAKNLPSIYRIHESPETDKLDDFRQLARNFQYRVGDLSQRVEVQKLLQAIKGKPEEYALKIAFLRSLKRAVYGTTPLGHYGLAKANYTNFTSPIRRYADLVTHRVLGRTDDGKGNIVTVPMNAIAAHISQTERKAEEASRESVKLKKIEFFALAANRQDTFDAVVLEVRNYGLFVELPQFLVSGMVHVSALATDFYIFNPTQLRLTGRSSHRTFTAGDQINVKVIKVDMYKQQIDFAPVDDPKPSRAIHPTSKRSLPLRGTRTTGRGASTNPKASDPTRHGRHSKRRRRKR